MRWWSRIVLAGLFLTSLPVSSMADICEPSSAPEKSDQARAEQLRLEAAQRAQREAERRNWEVKMFTVKNPIDDRRSNDNFRSLCIFRIEVVLQPGLKLVQVRAPKELMPTIEEAIKGLDLPAPPPSPAYRPKGAEITAYILVSSSVPNPRWMPVPRDLQSVADQLKGILPNDPIYLADTVVVRGMEGGRISLTGDTRISGGINIRAGAGKDVVSLSNLDVQSNGGGFSTSIEVPVGTQVVVGKASSTSADPNVSPNAVKRALLLVLSARILD
jgi:hypothetical protein